VTASAQPWRVGLFVLTSAALLAAALAFAGSPSPHSPPPPARSQLGATAPPESPSAAAGVARLRATLGAAARRFLVAFFRYEVGAAGPRVRAALRATATRGFAAELLAAPPRRLSRALAAAVPGRLRLAVASISPPRALVSGSAERDGEMEQFSFLFTARDGVWRASGPGE
jgi:hypothetical protein